jgi:hypothetical protein
MPVGDCQAAFGAAAFVDGIPMSKGYLAELTNAGHLALPPDSRFRQVLASIFATLGGDMADLASGAHAPLPLDWIVGRAHLIIEVDESQHFTTDRFKTLQGYPEDVPLAFSVSEYKALCQVLAPGSDRYRAGKQARGFHRPGGRRAQRAYFDAVKDLGAAEVGWRVFRVPAGHGDGSRAYREVRSRLVALVR